MSAIFENPLGLLHPMKFAAALHVAGLLPEECKRVELIAGLNDAVFFRFEVNRLGLDVSAQVPADARNLKLFTPPGRCEYVRYEVTVKKDDLAKLSSAFESLSQLEPSELGRRD